MSDHRARAPGQALEQGAGACNLALGRRSGADYLPEAL